MNGRSQKLTGKKTSKISAASTSTSHSRSPDVLKPPKLLGLILVMCFASFLVLWKSHGLLSEITTQVRIAINSSLQDNPFLWESFAKEYSITAARPSSIMSKCYFDKVFHNFQLLKLFGKILLLTTHSMVRTHKEIHST